MRRALAVIMAVLVSIVWLGMILGVPYLAVTGELQRWVPVDLQDASDLLGIDVASIGELVGVARPTGLGLIDEPVVVVAPTDLPTPEEVAPEATTPPTEEPSPTPTSTPTMTPTAEPEAEADTTLTVTATLTLTDTGELTGTTDITATTEITTSPDVTAVPELSSTPASTQGPALAIVASVANLRSGPGLEFDIVGTLEPPKLISVVGRDTTGEWFLINDGTWIFGVLLTEAPDVPVVDPNATVEPTAEATVEPTVEEIETPTPSAVVTTTPPITQTQAVTATINADANLRSGPGTEFDVVTGAAFGTVVTVVGRTEASDWYLLSDGNWVFATLLNGTFTDVPVVDAEGNIISGPNQGRRALDLVSTSAAAPVSTPATDSAVSLVATPTPEAEPTTSVAPDVAIPTETTSSSEIAPTETAPLVATTESDAATPTSGQATTSAPANLRAGPGIAFDITGSVDVGAVLTIIGQNPAGDWYQLIDNSWVFAQLVTNAPANLPVVETP